MPNCVDCHESSGCHRVCEQNEHRADWAEAAVEEFRRVCGGDMDETAIYDLIANLGHLWDRWQREGKLSERFEDMQFWDVLEEYAYMHYGDELPS